MEIKKNDSNSQTSFGLNMKLGPNLARIKASNKLPSKLSEQLEELRKLLVEIKPLDKDAYVDFNSEKGLYDNNVSFKYLIKPFEHSDEGAYYVSNEKFTSEDKFLERNLPKEALSIYAQGLYA